MNALETVNQAEMNMSSKMGDSLFKLGRYNRVYLDIVHKSLYEPLCWNSELWAFFSCENTPEEITGTHKNYLFFIKTSKCEKWWPWSLRMTNAFILCNLLWKVQKGLAANREGSFKCMCYNEGTNLLKKKHSWPSIVIQKASGSHK